MPRFYKFRDPWLSSSQDPRANLAIPTIRQLVLALARIVSAIENASYYLFDVLHLDPK